MEKKYEFSEETQKIDDIILHRIKALRDFSDVKKGDLGGWVEKESNLSHDGNCWIYNNAKAFNNAKVYGNSVIYNEVIICDSAHVYDNVRIFNRVRIGSNARVYGNSVLCGNVVIEGSANIYGNVWICGSTYVRDNAKVYDRATLNGTCVVGGNTAIFGEADITGNATIVGDAKVCSIRDYLVFKNWWSSGRYFTWTRSNDMWKVGCFLGTGEELIRRAYADSSTSGREYARIVKYVESIKSRIDK